MYKEVTIYGIVKEMTCVVNLSINFISEMAFLSSIILTGHDLAFIPTP